MIPVGRNERKSLEEVGLWKYKRTGLNPQDPNFTIANREHPSRAKTFYIAEEQDVMKFLEKWELCNNLQKITSQQLERLKNERLISEEKIQKSGTYVPNAFVYVAKNGDVYMEKIAKLMIGLGYWKTRK